MQRARFDALGPQHVRRLARRRAHGQVSRAVGVEDRTDDRRLPGARVAADRETPTLAVVNVAEGIDGVLLFVGQVHAHLSSTVQRSFGWVDNR